MSLKLPNTQGGGGGTPLTQHHLKKATRDHSLQGPQGSKKTKKILLFWCLLQRLFSHSHFLLLCHLNGKLILLPT